MKAVVISCFLFISQVVSAQDTISYAQLNDTSIKRDGFYVVEGVPQTVFNGERYVLQKATWYQTGEFVAGKRYGIWRTFRKGTDNDTLMNKSVYGEDMTAEHYEYRPNGIIKSVKRYANGKWTSMIGYYETGEKRYEQIGIKWKVPLLEGKELMAGYYKNGVLQSVGVLNRVSKNQNGRKVINIIQMEGDWYYFTDKGELSYCAKYRKGRLVKKQTFPTVGEFIEFLPQ